MTIEPNRTSHRAEVESQQGADVPVGLAPTRLSSPADNRVISQSSEEEVSSEMQTQQSSQWILAQSEMILDLVSTSDEKDKSATIQDNKTKKQPPKGSNATIGAIPIDGINQEADEEAEAFTTVSIGDVECGDAKEVITARPLTREELHEEVRHEIILESVKATEVTCSEVDDDNASSTSSKQQNNGWVALAIAVLIATVAAVMAGIFLSSNRDNNSDPVESVIATAAPSQRPSSQPTEAPTLSESQEELLQYLIDISQENETALYDIASPQYQAFSWLSEEFPDQYTFGDSLKERYALATLYFASNGDDWANNGKWMEHSLHICDWYSNSPARACENDNTFRELDLPLNNMDGTLPEEVSFLTALVNINLVGNKFAGTIPGAIFNSATGRTLFSLNLSGNAFNGTLPTEIGMMSVLQDLDIQNNGLTGTLPSEMGNMESLRTLRSERVRFTGSIPSEFGRLSRLEEWDARLGKLSGSLPEEIGNMKELRHLDFAGFQFLTGTIPESFYDLTSLTSLQLTRSGLGGTISSRLGKLTKLRIFEIGLNRFSGSLSSDIGLLTDLVGLKSGGNAELGGPIPPEVGFLTSTTSFSLSGCNFTGPLPTELGNMTRLVNLKMESNNFLGGPIPSEIGNMEALQTFNCAKCALEGTLPTEIAKLQNIGEIQLLENQLSGDIPGEWLWASASSLQVFGIGSRISGTIPRAIGLATNLRELYFHSNELTGTIPSELGLLTQLRTLVLYDNKFSSTLPSELANLSLLGKTHLDANLLSGTVPDSFCSATELFADCSAIECPCCTYCCDAETCSWTGRGTELEQGTPRDFWPLNLFPSRPPQ